MLTLKTIMSCIRVGDWLSLSTRKMPIFIFRSFGGTRKFVRFAFGGRLTNTRFFPLAGFGTENIHKVHGCCTSGPFQGVSEPSQGCCPPSHSWSWPLNEHQEEGSLPLLNKLCFWGVHLDSVQMQARLAPAWISNLNTHLARFKLDPSCLRKHLSQALRPHGQAPPSMWVAPHEGRSFGDEDFGGPLHRTSHSPCKGGRAVALTGWARSSRARPGVQSLDRGAPLLAHKLPGTEIRLPGTDPLSPLTQGVSCDCQDGQHGGIIPYNSPRGFTVAGPKQACLLNKTI